MKPVESIRVSRFFVFVGSTAALALVVYVFSLVRYAQNCAIPRISCLEHRVSGCTIDGVYELSPDARSHFDAYCDMKTDRGGWTLVANYLHRANSSALESTRKFDNQFPIPSDKGLGSDDFGTPAWGNISENLLNRFFFKEVRFSCRSSSHDQILDFALSSPACLNYFRTGKGSCAGDSGEIDSLKNSSRLLIDHTGMLPKVAEKGWKDQGENAMLYYPFYSDWKNLWGVGAANNRWECDDYETGGKNSTFHQIWIR